jgi:superfamily II DNA/RNA helicase
MSDIKSFEDLGCSRAVIDALAKQGVSAPFAIQNQVISDVLAGRDLLARSPTGSGKTLAFGIPIVDRIAAEAKRPAALILAPTRELALQIVEEIRPIAHARALRITAVYGGVGLLKQGQDAARAHIVVATPGRLEDQLQRGAFTLDHIQVLVLDEADRMLDMGFRPAVDRIVAACPAKRQTLFASATLEGEAGKAARTYTTNPVVHEHGPVDRRASLDVEHRFVEVEHERRVEALVEQLGHGDGLSLVFVRTKHGADKLVKRLAGHNVLSTAMHGGKTQRQRERALADFEAFRVDTLVATDVAARGIDINGISHVINFDPPGDSETYVHRIGRTGRAGAQGVGITLVGPGERGEVVKMARALGIEHGLPGTPGSAGERRGPGSGSTPARPQRRRRQRPRRVHSS